MRMKKGRASEMTRPEPTINGNCDSWASIVGKKGGVLGLVIAKPLTLRGRNEILSTIYQQNKTGAYGSFETSGRTAIPRKNAAPSWLRRHPHIHGQQKNDRSFYQIKYLQKSEPSAIRLRDALGAADKKPKNPRPRRAAHAQGRAGRISTNWTSSPR